MSAALSISVLLFGATGTVAGTVRYAGADLPPPPYAVDIDASTCGKKTPIVPEDLIVRAGGLANVAVIVAMPAEAPAPASALARLDQKNCTFLPHVQTMTLGSELEIGNSDPIIHNVHALIGKETIFNLGMPLQGVSVKRKLDRAGVHEISCDSGHWWMKAYAVVVPHRFHALTDAVGKFRIDDVPAGKQRITIWHERLGAREVEVEVEPAKETRVDVSFDDAAAPAEKAPVLGGQAVAPPLLPVQEDPSERRDAVRREGRSLYLAQCSTCHGERGDGRGVSAKFLSSAPRDFTLGEFKFRTTPSGRAATIDDLYRTIMLGIPGTEMPAFRRRLSQEQGELLAEYVSTFSARYLESHRIEPIAIPAPPPLEPGAVERGRALYAKLKCAQCHGTGGDGSDAENPIGAADLTRSFFKGGRGVRVIYRALTTGLSGSRMPSFGHLLDEAERWDLSRYVESLGGSGAGDWILDGDVGRRTTP